MALNFVIVEDHPIVFDALETVLKSIYPASSVTHAENGRSLLDNLATGPAADIVLLDLGLPDADPFDLVEAIAAAWPQTSTIVVSGENDPVTIRRLFGMGIRGYIPKTSRPRVMRSAIDLVLAGGIYLPPIMAGEGQAADMSAADQRPVELRDLTARQYDVLRLIARGMSNKQIADELGIEPGTVKIHVNAVMRKLGAANRTDAARRYLAVAGNRRR
jgi:DNA-binding NarL/FixJ family response regulator